MTVTLKYCLNLSHTLPKNSHSIHCGFTGINFTPVYFQQQKKEISPAARNGQDPSTLRDKKNAHRTTVFGTRLHTGSIIKVSVVSFVHQQNSITLFFSFFFLSFSFSLCFVLLGFSRQEFWALLTKPWKFSKIIPMTKEKQNTEQKS